MDRVTAIYLVETPLPVAQAAAVLAGEQSSGTFVAVPGETEELRARFAARVERITELETVGAPALPTGRAPAASYHRAEIEVSWPTENFGPNLPTLVATLQGNLYELAQFSGLKLRDFTVPASLTAHFRGPVFGVAGCRRLTGVEGRPLIGTIIKPSIGLTPAATAAMVKVLAEAGIDFVKDDELMANPPHSPFDARVDAVMAVLNAHAERTGKRVMYAFNISDEYDAMCRHYDRVAASGNTCAMLSLNSVGLAAAKAICDRGALAIHGHRNGWGMLNRHPFLGMEFPAYQKLWCLAGVDQLHVNGIENKFWEPDDSVVRSMNACLAGGPLGKPMLPVVSSGQWGGQAPETWRRTLTVDLLYMAGGGIQAHPDGPAAGVDSLRLWWQAAAEGLGFDEALAQYPALAQSAAKFGGGPRRPKPLLLAYYGDDFTGSTDALEFLSRAGLRTALFLAPPTPAQLARYPGLQAVGIAGLTRSLPPAAMEPELRSAFAALRELRPRHVHYKVCSTFDSSPDVGSIGRAIEVGASTFGGRWVPLLVAAPALGRYCLFGNLFARMGIGSRGEIYRLDRHPSMSRHPVTPADESDLRRHLARQTGKRIGLFDILQLELPPTQAQAALDALVAAGDEIVLFDALETAQLPRIGALIAGAATAGVPAFCVGSSGIDMALGAHWQGQEKLRPVAAWPDPGPAHPLLVVSGSCSAVTSAQIAWAEEHGFAVVPLEPGHVDLRGVADQAAAAMLAGRPTVVCSTRGAPTHLVDARVLGTQLGEVARRVLERTRARRLLLAGGDTSSYAGRALGIEAVEMIAPLAPGAPLCRASAPNSPANGIEINFKGGQVGAPDYFGAVARGRL